MFLIKQVFIKFLKYFLFYKAVVWFIDFNKNIHISLRVDCITALFDFFSALIDSQTKLHVQHREVINFQFDKVGIVLIFFLNFVHYWLVIHFKENHWFIKALNSDLIIILSNQSLLFSSFNRFYHFNIRLLSRHHLSISTLLRKSI